MARRSKVETPAEQDGTTDATEEFSIEEETVDPASLEAEGNTVVTLPVIRSDDELYRRRGTNKGDIPEPSAMFTEDRLLNTSGRNRAVPEGFWQYLIYLISLRFINVGDSR